MFYAVTHLCVAPVFGDGAGHVRRWGGGHACDRHRGPNLARTGRFSRWLRRGGGGRAHSNLYLEIHKYATIIILVKEWRTLKPITLTYSNYTKWLVYIRLACITRSDYPHYNDNDNDHDFF